MTITFAIPLTRLSAAAFWDRFTNAELVDFDIAMQHNPADTNAAKKAAARLRVWQRRTDVSGYVKIGSQRTLDFVNSLVPGVIASARATEILTTPIAVDEAYISFKDSQ
jgi:hypothetical protein